MAELLTPLALIFVVSAALLLLATRFRIPSVPVYIVVGLVIAPFIERGLTIDFAQFGIAFLVFVFGVYVEPDRMRIVARDSGHVAAVNVLVVGVVAYGIGTVLGLTPLDALYIAVAAALSSSLVGRELLGPDVHRNLVYSRLTQSIHFIQDLFAVLLILLLSASAFELDAIALELGYGMIVLLVTLLVRVYVFDLLVSAARGNDELVALTGIALLVLFIGGAELLDVSIVVGAFAAGVAIKFDFDDNLALLNALESLESFFVAIFFVTLGSLVTPPTAETVLLAVILVGCVALLKPFVTIVALVRQGYETRTACLTSFRLDQVSEFALIIAIQAFVAGRIDPTVFDAIVLAAAATMITSTVTRQYDEHLFRWLAGRWLFRSTHAKVRKRSSVPSDLSDHIVIVGYGTVGQQIARTCDRLGMPFVVVDHNPEQFEAVQQEHDNFVFGDIASEAAFDIARVADARAIVSTTSDTRVSDYLLRIDVGADIILRASTATEATKLYDAGAAYVMVPDALAAGALLDTLDSVLSGDTTSEQLQRSALRSLRTTDQQPGPHTRN